ncbi:unnamed protein product [Lampetra planeri]
MQEVRRKRPPGSGKSRRLKERTGTTEAGSEHAPSNRATGGISGEKTGPRTPPQNEKEEGEESSEDRETSASRRRDDPEAKEMEEAAPEPSMADWAEEVEAREDEVA